jgi:hypothetical protein
MADTFPVSGNIDPTSFPHLLVDLHHQGATGSLKINGPVFPKALYFRGGRILFGSSNDPRDQLGAILIESGKITREQLDDVNAKVGPGNPLAKVLAESGFVNQRELGDAARVKVERILSDVLSWTSGSFEFEDGVLPKGAVDLKLSTERLLLAAVQRIDDRSFALRHLGGDLSVVLEQVPEADATLSEVRAEVWPLLERLDGERSLNDAVALTRLEEFSAAKMACAMLFLGLVRRHKGEDELDLADEARSGFGEESSAPPSPGAGPTGVQDEPLGVREEPLGVQDEPLGVRDEAPAFSVEAPGEDAPGPTAFEIRPAEPVSFGAEEASRDLPPPFPAPEPEPEPLSPPAWEPRPPDESGFAFVDDSRPPRPAPEPEPPAAQEPPTLTPSAVSLSSPPAPADFAAPPPRKAGIDTVPGDRPAYVPPPPPPEPPRAEPPAPAAPTPVPTAPAPPAPEPPAPEPPAPHNEPAPSAPAARPTPEDLAALDARLNPSASTRGTRPADRSRPSWEPQFRSPSATTRTRAVSRRPAAAPRGASRAPLWAGLAGLVVAGAAASYFLLLPHASTSTPSTPAGPASPRVASTPALSAPATVAAAPTALPTAAPPDAPAASTPAAPVTPTPRAVTPAPAAAHPAATAPPPTPATPPPAARPTPAVASGPSAGSVAGSTDKARALLRQGALAESAHGFATSLATGPQGRFSVQTLVACAPETVQKAVDNVTGAELFILPVDLKGRACYRVCWGVYETRDAAEAAARGLPPYFRQSGISPRVTPLVELLP